ncbi:hypothetical protein ES708_31055 [subsurface metagenome]
MRLASITISIASSLLSIAYAHPLKVASTKRLTKSGFSLINFSVVKMASDAVFTP